MRHRRRTHALPDIWVHSAATCILTTGLLCVSWSGLARATPRYLRLSYTGDTATAMTVSWNTDSPRPSQVRFGTQSGVYPDTANGSSIVGNGALGHIHEVTLTGLAPNTQYYYVAGSADGGWSAEATFTTGPVEHPQCGSFSFVVLGDNRPDATLGGGENWPQILAQAMNQLPSFTVNGGDLVIDGDRIDQWLDFLGWTEASASRVPFMPCIGNHDDGPGEGDGANYNQIFALPRSEGTGSSGTEDYYFFTFGNAIFVALSTQSFKGGAIPFQNQADWLDEVLTANPRKWKFVYYHKPTYTKEVFFSISHEPNEADQNAALVPVIDQHHVDVVFTSHNHWYERFEPSACATQGNPGSDRPCSVGATNYAGGTVYYVTGGAGAFTIPGWLCGSETGRAFCSGDHHYIHVSIQDHVATLETWGAYPQTNEIIDSITITKPDDSCAQPTYPDAGVPDASVPDDGAVPHDGAVHTDGASPTDAVAWQDGSAPDASHPGSAPHTGCGCHSQGGQPLGALTLLMVLFALGALRVPRRRPPAH